MSSAQVNPRDDTMVVGIDGSEGSVCAMSWAIANTALYGRVLPVAAWELPFRDRLASIVGRRPELGWFEAQAGEMANEAMAPLDDDACAEPVVIQGHPGKVLCGAAATSRLLVVGSRGRSAIAEAATGSVSSYCAAHAPVPAAIVPLDSPAAEPSSICVGVDGSDLSVNALIWAIEHAPPGVPVEAVSCMAPTGPAFEIVLQYMDSLRKHAEEALSRAVDEAEQRTKRPDVKVSGRVLIGDPRSVLRDTTSDLVVVGARGHEGVGHLLLGSVATALAHNPLVPTIIVR